MENICTDTIGFLVFVAAAVIVAAAAVVLGAIVSISAKVNKLVNSVD
jgi:hypothetical protein